MYDEEKQYKKQMIKSHDHSLPNAEIVIENNCRHLLSINHAHRPDFSEEHGKEEALYKTLLHSSHAVSREQVLDRISDRNEQDMIDVERSQQVWKNHPNNNGGDL